MLYSAEIKNHWLKQIELKKGRFNPDCGDHLSSDGVSGAPQHVLIEQFDNVSATTFEQEFQLPIWLINFMTGYYHQECPELSYVIVKEVFENVPTNTCLEPVRHKLAIKWLTRLMLDCGLQCSRFDSAKKPHYLGSMIGFAIVEHQLCLADPLRHFDIVQAEIGSVLLTKEIFAGLNDEDNSGADFIKCTSRGWMWNVPSYYRTALDNLGKHAEAALSYRLLYQDLIDVLKEES